MDTLIAQASESLAKAGMNRRGFLGKLAGAAGGAAVLTTVLATAARADSCLSGLKCRSCKTIPGGCGCRGTNYTVIWEVCYEVDCHTGEKCGGEWRRIRGCGLPRCD